MNCKEPHISGCKCLTFVFLFSVLIFFYPNRTRGGEFKIIPFLNLKQEYNDNILLNEDEINDIITTLSPGFVLTERTERLDSDFYGQIDKIIYVENNELDALDYYCRANVSYQLNERANIDSQAQL